MAGQYRITADRRNNRNRCRCRLGRQSRSTARNQNVHLTPYEFCRQLRQPIVVPLAIPIFDHVVPAFDVSGFAQSLPKRRQILCSSVG
jgi:hypothetical protein